MKFTIIEGHNKFAVARMTPGGLRYRQRLLFPLEFKPLGHGTPADASSGLGGAAVGAALFGGAGAIVGAIAGSAGKTGFIVKTMGGTELIGSVKGAEYPELLAEFARFRAQLPQTRQRMRNELAAGEQRGANEAFLLALPLGPLYFVRFGVLWFLGTSAATFATAFVGWLGLPFLARHLHLRKRRRELQDIRALVDTADPETVPNV